MCVLKNPHFLRKLSPSSGALGLLPATALFLLLTSQQKQVTSCPKLCPKRYSAPQQPYPQSTNNYGAHTLCKMVLDSENIFTGKMDKNSHGCEIYSLKEEGETISS